MELKNAVAGTLESGDIMIQIGPGEGLNVELQSSVAAQFGRQIKSVITPTLMSKPRIREPLTAPSAPV